MFYFTHFKRVLFTFPSQYWFTIGHRVVLSLWRWSSWIHAGFHVSRVTRDVGRKSESLSRTRLSLSVAGLSRALLLDFRFVTSRQYCRTAKPCPTTPRIATPAGLHESRFRLVPVRSPLLRESQLLSFPPGTEMVHFPGLASGSLWIQLPDGPA